MGSPKELQRLQLKPDNASENTSLRSPISSRIWQAEDPTRHLGFTGEDLSMRNFCVSVHGDNDFMEGSFSFDTEGDRFLGTQRDSSVESLSSFPDVGANEHTTKHHECSRDLSKADKKPERSLTIVQVGEITNIDLKSPKDTLECEDPAQPTQCDSKVTRYTEGVHPEPAIHGLRVVVEYSSDIKTEATTVIPQSSTDSLDEKTHPIQPCVTTKVDSTLNTSISSGSPNTLGEVLPNIPMQEKDKKMIPEKSEFQQDFNTRVDEIKTSADGNTGCKESANGDLCELVPPNNTMSTQADRVEYRSIAISPIVPPDGRSSFTFQSGIEIKGTSSVTNSYNIRTAENESNSKEELPKTCSFELTAPNQDVGTDTRVQCRSIAVSPIVPPGGSTSFTFQTENSSLGSGSSQRTDTKSSVKNVEYKSVAVSPIIPPDGSSFTFQTLKNSTNITPVLGDTQSVSKTYSFELTPPNHDIGTQADTRAECVSVAVSPIIPPDGSSSFIFQTEQKQQELLKSSTAMSGEKQPIPTASTLQNQASTSEISNKVQYVSVAVSPIVPPDGSSSFTFLTEKAAQYADHKTDTKNIDNLPKTYSFELTPPSEDAGTDNKVEYRSVAVSPIIPPGESSFTFQTEKQNLLPKTYSFELTPPSQEVGTQADNKVECVSVAVSPFVLPLGSSTFTFQADQRPSESSAPPTDNSLQLKPQSQDVGVQVDTIVQCTSIAVSPFLPMEGSCSFTYHTEAACSGVPSSECVHAKPSMKDAEMQVSFPVETRSIATDPMTPIGKSPRTSYPEVKVKEQKSDLPEPVREVSWDEKGMTWEVYGASMEVEVLGMAIQKHLEKQIEEHGRQKVMTPQNTRGSSIRGTTAQGENKRQPNTFRSFFHSVRRPRCCSRAAPAVE
ncbi:G protein-regulated inducer of neurite outgrowth 1 [Pelodytes ibericus]